MALIREEIAADYDAIREVNRIAFGGNDEAEIVDRLRSTGVVVVSLVAIQYDEIVGHIMSADFQSRWSRASLKPYHWLRWQSILRS